MKKYQNTFPVYGQTTAGRINYYQKLGVAKGIERMIEGKIGHDKLEEYVETIDFGNCCIKSKRITAVIPTKDTSLREGECPAFFMNGERGVIDMIHINGELQFHMMKWHYENRVQTYTNAGWHTVRECLSLEDTCTLFEYIEDKLDDIIILPIEESDKYNETGALSK